MTKNETVAILGAGLQGALCALELAERGCNIVLFDQNDTALSEASLHNEGKVHLGYIYTNDDLNRTAKLMAMNATLFTPYLARWMPEDALTTSASSPFVYLVMKDSLLDPDTLEAKYAIVDEMVADGLRQPGHAYFGDTEITRTHRLPKSQWEGIYNEALVAAAFQTPERSVHLPIMAAGIRAALQDHPRITCRWNARITAVSRASTGYIVHLEEGDAERGFGHVINALWGNRLKIDETLGIQTDRPFLLRRKVASYVTTPDPARILPSATMVLGGFGDVVGYPDGRHYLSWYPTGCIDRTDRIDVPETWFHPLCDEEAAEVFNASIDALDQRVFGVRTMVDEASTPSMNPGIIFTWGCGDVDDLDSELHQRFDVGPNTHWGSYHSVDTGKLSLAPHFAIMTADRIAPK